MLFVSSLAVLSVIGAVSLNRASAADGQAVPMHRMAPVGGGWYLRVNRVTSWNAASLIASVPGQYPGPTPPQAARDVMLDVTFAYEGSGRSDLRLDLADRVFVVDAVGYLYGWDSGSNDCGPGEIVLPPPDAQTKVETGSSVARGTTIEGHICFEVFKTDVSTLRLYVKPPTARVGASHARRLYFALRSRASRRPVSAAPRPGGLA